MSGSDLLRSKYVLRLCCALALFAWFVAGAGVCFGEKFRDDDPLLKDNDMQPVPEPLEKDISQAYDFAENSFVRTKGKEEAGRAANINSLGEVPDSSWFTNRIGVRDMTPEDVSRGPDEFDGPDTSGPWVVTRAKSEGISPGFTIKDARGDTYFIKFDPLKHAQLATSAEVICTKFFHAFGYNVPENYLASLRPEMLQVSPEATMTDLDGQKRKMTENDIKDILKMVPLMPDGSIQVIASRRLSGAPVGHFKYWGTRSDDANDIFPHQDRRELRGLRIFSAWLNHDDSRSINSLDMYLKVGEEGGYVKHHLLDFGSTLGSGSVQIQGRRASHEYMIEWGPIAKSAITFGIWDRFWRYIEYPDYPSIGRYESKVFRPEAWRTEYPNPAFERIQNEDAFWAVRILSKFTDDIVREVVKTGRYTDPEAEKYLVDTMLERRDKIIRYYLSTMNTLHDFRLSDSSDALQFEDLGVSSGVGTVASYSHEWFQFDNNSGQLTSIAPASNTTEKSIRHSILFRRIPDGSNTCQQRCCRLEEKCGCVSQKRGPEIPCWN